MREIFARHGAGESCQRIAADLNRRSVTGPRGGTWSVSALYSSPAKGAGILNNRLYVGEIVWNRSQWIKVRTPVSVRASTGRDRNGRRQRFRSCASLMTNCGGPCGRMWIGRSMDTKAAVPRPCSAAYFVAGRAANGGRDRRVPIRLRGAQGPGVCSVSGNAGTTPSHGLPAAGSGARRARQRRGNRRGARRAARLFASTEGEKRPRTARQAALQREVGRLNDAGGPARAFRRPTGASRCRETEMNELERATNRTAPTADEIVARYRANLLRLTEALQSDAERARAALKTVRGGIRVERREDGVYGVLEMQPAVLLLGAGSQMGLVDAFMKWNRCKIKGVTFESRIPLPDRLAASECVLRTLAPVPWASRRMRECNDYELGRPRHDDYSVRETSEKQRLDPCMGSKVQATDRAYRGPR